MPRFPHLAALVFICGPFERGATEIGTDLPYRFRLFPDRGIAAVELQDRLRRQLSGFGRNPDQSGQRHPGHHPLSAAER